MELFPEQQVQGIVRSSVLFGRSSAVLQKTLLFRYFYFLFASLCGMTVLLVCRCLWINTAGGKDNHHPIYGRGFVFPTHYRVLSNML